MLAGRSIQADTEALANFDLALLAAAAVVLAMSVGAGWWFTSRAIRPIEQISTAAMRISGGNLAERIPVADRDNELGRLADVLNTTFSRLEAAFVRQRQFTADAAHELRTPLTVIITELQTTLARERTGAEYRESMDVCLGAAQQMRKLAESLFELERLDVASDQPRRDDVDLAGHVRAAIELTRPLAEKHGVTVQSELEPAHAFSTPDRVSRVITNLLTNAIHYNKAGGEVHVSTHADSQSAILIVSDTGPGIAAADLPRIFDRFYRVDKARSRADGHTGLGLAISKAIVEAEGGAIEVVSTEGVGTTFEVRLPVPPAA